MKILYWFGLLMRKVGSKELRPYILPFLMLALGMWLGSRLFPKTVESVITKTEIKVDTVTVEIPKTEVITVRITEHHTDTLYRPSTPLSSNDLPIIRYSGDSVVTDGLRIGYDAIVRGYLDDIRLTYHDTRPETIKYITKQITIEKEKPRSNYSIYAGVTASLPSMGIPLSVYPTIDLSIKKNVFGYGYDLVNGTHLVSYKYRIF